MKCFFCDSEVNNNGTLGLEIYDCKCPNCGHYRITKELFEDESPYQVHREFKEKKHLISGFIFEMNDLKLPLEVISIDNITYLFNNSKIPHSSFEKLYKLLLHIYRNTTIIYEEIKLKIKPGRPAIGYAKNSDELFNMISALKDLGYIELPYDAMGDVISVVLTLKGIEKAESLKNEVFHRNQGFVAMWFDDEMKNVFHDYISQAISETGYDPLIIDMIEHNEDICDHIIAEIRRSRFLIADFTGDRGGVYFEAGFAYGLGMPVIWTCRNDWFDKVHFDVEHYNFIIWEDGEELKEKLINRIMATIPKA